MAEHSKQYKTQLNRDMQDGGMQAAKRQSDIKMRHIPAVYRFKVIGVRVGVSMDFLGRFVGVRVRRLVGVRDMANSFLGQTL